MTSIYKNIKINKKRTISLFINFNPLKQLIISIYYLQKLCFTKRL